MEKKLIILDVETTGLDQEDRLCEVAYLCDGIMHEEQFKPPLPIKVGAMAVSHITNKMVADKPCFVGSEMQKHLQDLSDNILVAHNAPFDMAMLKKDGVVFEKYIDTKKLSHELDKFEEMESHRLQFLRYYYDIELPNAVAHSAEGDVRVLEAVYKELCYRLGNPSLEKQMEISKRPVLYRKFKFGKYRDNLIEDIVAVDPGYLEWLLKQKKENNQNEEDWIYTLEYYLNN